MKPALSPDLEFLLNRLVDGLITESEHAEFESLLSGSREARDLYRHFMHLHSALHWDYAVAATPEPGAESGSSRWRRFSAITAIAAAVLLAAFAIQVVSTAITNRPAIFLDAVNGAVSWTGGKGEWRNQLVPGDRLPTGTLLVDGDDASIRFHLRDGAELTLGSRSELTVNRGKCEPLILRRGILTARVLPRPKDRPMTILTPSATADVLGTAFAIEAEPASTRLSVESGRVKLRRLVDGATVEIGRRQEAIATLDAKQGLEPTLVNQPDHSWHMDFSQSPSPNCKGTWRPPSRGKEGSFGAVPLLAGRREDGQPIIHHGVTFRTTPGHARAFVSLTPESILRLRCRMDEPHRLKFFLSTERQEGTFGGNFEGEINLTEMHPDASGVIALTCSLSDVRATDPARHPTPADMGVFLLMVHSIEKYVGLEILEIEILPEPGSAG